MQSLPPALAALGAYKQFLCYRLDWDEAKQKNKKTTVDPWGGYAVDAHDSTHWLDALAACERAAALGPRFGVAFTLTTNDPFFFVDIDNCATPAGWSAQALEVAGWFPGAAVEVSQSGTGLHIIGSGIAPEHRMRDDARGLEFYTEGRFIALTGLQTTGDAGTDHTVALHGFTATYFAPRERLPNGTPAEWTTGPNEHWDGPQDDDQLIERALRSSSAAGVFTGRASFADLWHADHDALGRTYPDTTGAAPYNASAADAALAGHLAFWTGKDCERIERLMRRSALARAKWDDREDYYLREKTILGAVMLTPPENVCTGSTPEPTPNMPVAPDSEHTPAVTPVTGNTFLGADEQAALFKGCAYVLDAHKCLITGGRMIRPEQFRAIFGGNSYMMDPRNERISRNAWEAFTESQSYRAPRADTTCFRPELAPGQIIHEAGRTMINTWWPVTVPRAVGDASLFLDHLRKVLPDERDREILLAYMCACVQHKGVKFQWAPFLQGVEGNGKTLFTRCVAEALGRRYVHWPKAAKLTATFNAWLDGRLLIAVEDVYISEGRVDMLEQLKPMITGGDGLEIEAKGVDQVSRDICCNFMLNSNHKGGIRKTRNDRRFAPFLTAQQQFADIARDGMDGPYFERLYGWLKTGGYAIVSELLHTRPIPDEFNPATLCQRAPDTTSTVEAIEASLGSVEQEIQEAVAQGLPGFASGWISSIFLQRLLDEKRMAGRVPINQRRDLLGTMGYIPHPALPDGRVSNPIAPDGGRPRLFIQREHALRFWTDRSMVLAAYTDAQKSASLATQVFGR